MSAVALACFSTIADAECARNFTALGLGHEKAEGEEDEDGFHDE